MTQAFLPALRRAKGRIIFMGSIAGLSAAVLELYAASKHALEAVADSLRLELRPFGIHVSIVEPGSIKTAIWARSAQRADELIAASDGELEDLYGRADRSVPKNRARGAAPPERRPRKSPRSSSRH